MRLASGIGVDRNPRDTTVPFSHPGVSAFPVADSPTIGWDEPELSSLIFFFEQYTYAVRMR
jgi:hypothetical protein